MSSCMNSRPDSQPRERANGFRLQSDAPNQVLDNAEVPRKATLVFRLSGLKE
jgi:hypothetical protein